MSKIILQRWFDKFMFFRQIQFDEQRKRGIIGEHLPRSNQDRQNKATEFSTTKPSFFTFPVIPSASNTAALLIKNWITMKRNLLLLLFVFFLPALILLINCITVGLSPVGLPLALVNHENNCSETFYSNSCEANMLSCYFKQALNKSETVELVNYSNESAAIRDTENAAIRGKIVIPEHFSTSVLKRVLSDWRFDNYIYFYSVKNPDDVGKFEKIDLSLDSSDPQLALFVIKSVTESIDNFVQEVSKICKEDLGDELDFKVLLVDDPILGKEDTDFREFITPGIIALVIFFLAMALTSESFIAERSQGLLERSYVTGVLPLEILASYIMSQFLVMVVQVLKQIV